MDSNHWPTRYERGALTNWATSPKKREGSGLSRFLIKCNEWRLSTINLFSKINTLYLLITASLPLSAKDLLWYAVLMGSVVSTLSLLYYNRSFFHFTFWYHTFCFSEPNRSRTCNLHIRSVLLYPIELWVQIIAVYERIELSSPAWQAGILAVERIDQNW